jgi:hypothetical protein
MNRGCKYSNTDTILLSRTLISLTINNARSIPLVSATRNYVWLILAEYNNIYQNFLENGEPIDNPFLTLPQYGLFNLREPHEFERVSCLVVALLDNLQNSLLC